MAASPTMSAMASTAFKLALLLAAISSVVGTGSGYPRPPSVSFSVHKWNSKSGIKLSQDAHYASNGTYVALLGPGATTNTAGGAFHSSPVAFVDPHTNKPASFSTSFTFAIQGVNPLEPGDGIAFAIKPSPTAVKSDQGEYIGLFDPSKFSNGDPAIKTVAVEVDTYENSDVSDTSVPHIGLDINSIVSAVSADASAIVTDAPDSLQKVTVWVDYNARAQELVVFAAQAPARKFKAVRLFSYPNFNLASYINAKSYVGFTAASGEAAEDNFIYSWSFKTFF